jgi:hypothetical protein
LKHNQLTSERGILSLKPADRPERRNQQSQKEEKQHDHRGRRYVIPSPDQTDEVFGTHSANPLWGAPHIHGELLKLGFEIAQSTVARYMCRGPWPPSRDGGRFSRITSMASRRSICLSCRRLRFRFSIVSSFCATGVDFGCRSA